MEEWQPWLDLIRNLILSGILVSAVGAFIRFGRFLERFEHLQERVEEVKEAVSNGFRSHDEHLEKIATKQAVDSERLATVESGLKNACRLAHK